MGTVREIVTLTVEDDDLDVPQAGDSYKMPVTLNATTGNEIACEMNYVTNKATSGDDTGLLIKNTATSAPGTSLFLDLKLGTSSKFTINTDGLVTIDKAMGYGTTSGLRWGDGDTGFYEEDDDILVLSIGGVRRAEIDSDRTNLYKPFALIDTYTVATLPSSYTGTITRISDGDSGLAWGATAVNSGGGATKYLVWYNGTNWTILGK